MKTKIETFQANEKFMIWLIHKDRNVTDTITTSPLTNK